MATYTSNLNLKKPDDEDFFSISDFNQNSDILDVQVNAKIAKPTSFTSGNIVNFTTGGQVVDSGKKTSDFMASTATYATVGADASGSAATVQTNLNTHTSSSTLHLTSAEKTKLSTVYTTSDIVVSSSQPSVSEGRIWIKVE